MPSCCAAPWTLRHFALFSRCRLNRYALSACAAAFIILQSAASVSAHPHVWVTIHSDVLYGEDGAMIGVRHVWTFDDMYSAFELQGVPHVEKGQYTRHELGSLAHLNVTSMTDYDFFTFVRAEIGAASAIDWNLISADFYRQALEAEQRLPMARQSIRRAFGGVGLSARYAIFAYFVTR
ncbi:MAG TPA: DUF1007 family protein [Bradyrhizobium sp.]|nr:DUF1007 family protein [Bradyrhizobium sp.]